MIEQKEIIKIKNKTKLGYNLEQIAKEENTLRGIYVKEILNKIESEPENKEMLEKALEIGIEVLSQEEKLLKIKELKVKNFGNLKEKEYCI